MSDWKFFNVADAHDGLTLIDRLEKQATNAQRQRERMQKLVSLQDETNQKMLNESRMQRRLAMFVDRLQERAKEASRQAGKRFAITGLIGLCMLMVNQSVSGVNALSVSVPVLIAEAFPVAVGLFAGYRAYARETRTEKRVNQVRLRRSESQERLQSSLRSLEMFQVEKGRITEAQRGPYEAIAATLEGLRAHRFDVPDAPEIGESIGAVQYFLGSRQVVDAREQAEDFIAQHAPAIDDVVVQLSRRPASRSGLAGLG